jgi:hypothetical protein
VLGSRAAGLSTAVAAVDIVDIVGDDMSLVPLYRLKMEKKGRCEYVLGMRTSAVDRILADSAQRM